MPFKKDIFKKMRKLICGRWLDLACGNGAAISLVKKTPDKCVDLRDFNLPNFEKANVFDWLEKNEEKYDTVTAMDFVEHLTKQDALDFLNKAERIAKRIIIKTPKGFMPEHGDYEFSEHKCGFSTEDFEARGYKVIEYKNAHERDGIKYGELLAYKDL